MILRTPMNGRVPMVPASSGLRPSFNASFINSGSIVPARGTSPTFTRSTVASITDQDLVVRQVLSGEARFGGFRRAQSLVAVSENLTNGAWTSAGAGSKTATTITFTNSNYTQRINVNGGVGNGKKFVISFKASVTTGTAAVRFETLDNADSSDINAITPTLTTTLTRYSFIADYSASVTITTLVFYINRLAAVTAGAAINFTELQAEEVTGQSNQNPGEYQSVGVLAAPYQGANVDGVAYYPYLNGNTVASNVVTEAQGANINGSSNIGALPGVAGSYFSTPDSVANSITGDIDIRVKVAMADWTPAASGLLVDKLVAGQRSYDFFVVSTGVLEFRCSTDGVAVLTATGLTATGFKDGTTHWVRATRASATGTVTFYTSEDGVTWTQLGVTAATTAGAIFDSTATLAIGANTIGTNFIAGKIYRAQIYNGINGTLAVDFNPNSWTTGATWVSATSETWTINGNAKVLAVSLGGYLSELAATQILPLADVRDMTTVGWTLGATLTRARTSVGWDGVANKATRLTGGAVAATNIITTTIVAAATSRTYSVGIKRITGTGPVRITQDNFATSTDISSLINSTTYTLVQLNQSQLNAVMGIKVDTNLDAIDADFNQFGAGDLTGLVNSRIPDSTATRNADVLTYATTGWLNAAAGTLYGEWFNPNLSQTAAVASINDTTANNRVTTLSETITSSRISVLSGGVAQSDLSAAILTAGAINKNVNIYQLNDFAGFSNNTTLGTDVAGTIPALTQLQIGNQLGSNQLGHYIRKISYYPSRLPNSVAQSLTV